MYQPDEPRSVKIPPAFELVESAGEAQENLRVIRMTMERSTRHSTFSGFSGIVIGMVVFLGYWLTRDAVLESETLPNRLMFIGVWSAVLTFSILVDYLLTKRRAAQLGKTALSPLGKQLTRAAMPGFFAALAMTVYYATHPGMVGPYLFGFWMLCYAVSLLAVGMFSVKEVSYLGWAFLLAGAVTLILPVDGWYIGPRGMVAIAFGGFHIVYGVYMGYKYGW